MLSSQLLGNALESAPDAIVIVDESGRILFVNHQVTALLGYEPQDILARQIETLMPERFRSRHLAHRRGYAEGARFRPMGIDLELYALHKDGSELPVEISLSPIRDGERLLVAAAIRDVSERKRIQIELVRASEAAERANQAKSRFLATASHDLRQPLQTLALLNGSLRRIVREPTALEAVGQQSQAIEAMSRLLNALLDISKLESGAIHPDPSDFRVAALLDEMRSEFASLAADKGLELRIDSAAQYAHSDPSLVGQVLRNLVSNAIKYTQRGWVELRSRVNGRSVEISVADTGIGIAPEQLPYIYDEFYQVGVASNATRDGYGLGLSIVHRIVSLLGLKLRVQSSYGAGSVFTLDVPVGAAAAAAAAAAADAAPQAHAAEPRARAPQILLVDDDPGVRNATAMLLKVEGYRVLSAGSLEEARRVLAANPDLDLLATDYHLTDGCTGVDVIAAARSMLGRRVPAVLVTGDTSSSMRELQADPSVRFASKPINADQFLELLQGLIEPHR